MKEQTTVDQILDLLLDALQERQAARGQAEAVRAESERPTPTPPPPPTTAVQPTPLTSSTAEEEPSLPPIRDPLPNPLLKNRTKRSTPRRTSAAPPPRQASINLGRMLGRLFVGLIGLIVLINIPFNRHGTALARAMPDNAALIIRDGLLLKGSGDEIYVLESNQRRWITTLDAFEYYGYRWENVHEVDDDFINQFEEGRPVHLLVKCATSPHVYALEDGQKRWIKDVPTLETFQVPWEMVQIVGCQYLRDLPDGIPFPADAGEPPQP